MSQITAEAEAQYAIQKASNAAMKAGITYLTGRGIPEDIVKGFWINAFVTGWEKGLRYDLENLPRI